MKIKYSTKKEKRNESTRNKPRSKFISRRSKKISCKRFQKNIRKKLSIEDLETEVMTLTIDNIFREVYLKKVHSLYSEYKKNIQIHFPIPEYLED